MNYKNWLIFRPIKDIYDMFFNKQGGFSYRKAGATFALIVAYKLSMTITDDSVKKEVIFYWQTLGATFVGLVSATKVIDLFFNKQDKTKENENK